MMHEPSRVQDAVDFVRRHHAHSADVNGKLPSVRVWAAQAGVSSFTMWKALRVLCGSGELRHTRMDRFRTKGAPLTAAPADSWCSYPYRVRRTLGCLADDIRNGVFPPGRTIPLRKTLIDRYGVSLPTLRTALHIAVRHGMVEPGGRDLRVPFPTQALHADGQWIALLMESEGGAQSLTSFLSDIDNQLMRHLEQLTAQSGTRLVPVPFFENDNGTTVFPAPQSGAAGPRPEFSRALGAILVVNRSRALCRSLIETLSRARIPVAVLDEIGVDSLKEHFAEGTFRIFTASTSSQSGRAVGAFCTARGTNNAAYISPFHGDQWSQQRLAGLRLTGVGPLNVSVFTVNRTMESYIFHPVGSRRMPKKTRMRRPRGESEAREWFNHTMAARVDSAEYLMSVYRVCLPLFRAAIREKGARVWICANDVVATMALHFLKRRAERIEPIGFDNSSLSLYRRITSFDFNLGAIAAEMLRFIVAARQTRKNVRWRLRTVATDGFIVERET